MSDSNESLMNAFTDELNKLSAGGVLPGLARRALSAGSGAALGGVGGAALGAGAGAIHGGLKAREEGGSALGGALGGLGRGAIRGGGLGFVGGAVGGAALPGHLAQVAGNKGALGAISRFGQRQAHSITGALPAGFGSRSEAIRSIGGGGAETVKQLGEVSKKLPGAMGKEKNKLFSEQARLQKALQGATAAEEVGMTSIPGLLRSMANPKEFSRGMRGAAQQQWHGSGGARGKLVTVGLPVGIAAGEAARPSQEGESGRLPRAAKSAVEGASYLMPMGIGAQALMSAGAGAGMKKLLPHSARKRLPETMPEEATAGRVERIESPAAQGKPPDGWGL